MPSTAGRDVMQTLPFGGQAARLPRLGLAIEVDGGAPSARALTCDGELCRIGSHPSNDLVLSDERVSRFHCRLEIRRGVWRITDAGSLNGTRVEGVRVLDAELPLPECRLEIGASTIRVRDLGAVDRVVVPAGPDFGALCGTSVPMRRLFALLECIAPTESTVLIEGESGTGKELIATEIVQRGPRADGPLVIVDCGAISPALVESELFGHARGAFTGADRERVGAFEAATGGTLFLDEIGELPLELQPKLLRALEAREIRRVGETRVRRIDTRVIAATNRTLEREVNERRFRDDLYFRLSVVTVRVPPLRERLDDIGPLVAVFLRSLRAPDAERLFTPEVLGDMARYDWPGNVRELRNYVERAVVFRTAGPARADSSPPRSAPSSGRVDLDVPFHAAKESAVRAFERAYLLALLQWSGGNVSVAARRAGLHRIHLHRLIQRYGIRRDGA